MADRSDDAWVDNSMFEGLFQRALKPSEAMSAELRSAGYDPKNPQARYRPEVWRNALEIARRHEFPTLPHDEGLKALGRRFVDGFFQTIIGKFVAVALPMLGSSMMQRRVPSMFKMARKDLDVSAVEESPNRYRLIFKDKHPSPEFVAGFMEGIGFHLKRPAVARIENRSAEGYELVVDSDQPYPR